MVLVAEGQARLDDSRGFVLVHCWIRCSDRCNGQARGVSGLSAVMFALALV